MMILGSKGFRDPIHSQKIGKLIPDQGGNMLIIPLACMFEMDTGVKEKNGASMLDFKKDRIFVFDRTEPEEFLNRSYDYIVVPGGNTFKLLHFVREFHLDTFIKQQVANGAIYLGFSAGAYLASQNIEYVQNFDANDLITNGAFTALGLTDKFFLCHFDSRGPEEIAMCRSYIGAEPELITINEEQLVVL